MLHPTEIKECLQQGFIDALVEVEGDGRHFRAVIISSEFEGKTLLQQQRMVYAILSNKMPEIHALSMRTLTPEQAANGE